MKLGFLGKEKDFHGYKPTASFNENLGAAKQFCLLGIYP